jgi:hypothetical protein
MSYMLDSLQEFDPFYDPNGDGQITADEVLLWDPHQSSPAVQRDLRKLDLTGNLKRPIIVAHGTWDVLIPPGEADAYKRLVERQLGVDGARDVHALYYIPRMGHGGGPFNAFVPLALDALDKRVDYHQSGGASGVPAPEVRGGYPRD